MTSSPSASLFSLPLAPWQQPQSIRTNKYEPRKRRRGEDEWGDEDESEDEVQDVVSGPEITTGGSSTLVLSPEEAHQYRIAGQPFDQELPGGHFPHAAADGSGKKLRKNYTKKLSTLSPPLYVPQSAAQQGNLRLRHLAVLTAILHRCLLEGDYVRAGRAWGLILREEIAGHPIDVRNEGRWGLGAEILLRRDSRINPHASSQRDNQGDAQRTISAARPFFTRKGFEEAKAYYERLILQYPYRKASPESVSSLDFYPAMFGLWIYVVQEESNIARERLLQDRNDKASESPSEEDDAMSESDLAEEQGKRKSDLIAGIRSKELEEAQQIAARMDELLVSPPYSDSPELLRLRGMVALWVGDLFVSSVPQGEDDTSELSDQDSMGMEESPEAMIARREKRLATEKRDAERERSREFLEKAEMRSKGVSHSFEDLHINDTSLS
ncbi:hypothetical protein VTN96DRAFT_5521 [Rasamsonia emersonii]|uniref:RNA polymerase I-specific transcription initiation factor rrn11 n=1 Tax=Rasamsonia emersonii (strain ATCC 16479 / CBS 393.64 / IMI 116815) TaxID=1408163 RepID=A0A0F4Z4A9_RASE3|nr:hypothetical protein T310_0617 [Rasamsonia emersonii CBS 393.64]KKA25369.1 hypothetical protein T310_0617 [Rasamsonia emersonii CBS 393.64]